uniref:sensor histidine kinase n=1 Tax=Acetatifactor sp. TaxID=1872090 RepID=UPI00405604C1
MEKQLKYYKDMELMDTELRKFRHDVKNHFICMESLLNTGNIEQLQEYFDEFRQSFSFSERKYNSGNEIIDAILNHDLIHHCKKEINVTVYGTVPKLDSISALDLCTLFSNLLSNAVTAANQCCDMPNPQINIHFSGGKKYFSIVISNTIPVESKVKKNDRNHGFGIRKIKSVLKKYGGTYEINTSQQLFTFTIFLPI